MSTIISLADIRESPEKALEPWRGRAYRVALPEGLYWTGVGNNVTADPLEAAVGRIDDLVYRASGRKLLDQAVLVVAEDYDGRLSRIPGRSPPEHPWPSSASQPQSRTAHSTHTPASTQHKDGRQVQLFAVVLPAALDLLSGSGGTPAVVLELAAYETKSGVRHTSTHWHGPFPTAREAKDFLAQLAAQPPTSAGGPSAGPAARDV